MDLRTIYTMRCIGIDEVGRGCWAGPLVAAAVMLNQPVDGLMDSKVLTARRREILAAKINKNAHVGLGWVTANEVDELGLTDAVRLAMQRAYNDLAVEADSIIIDGNYNYFADLPQAKAIIKADATVPEVSAASIVAKVARDNYMRQLALKYPNYGFDKHVGYGTADHQKALNEFGICLEHRKSYKPIKALLQYQQ